jgi:hypothetical protein
MERPKTRERYLISSPEFLSEFREKMAERLEQKYPLEEAGATDTPDKVRKGIKFPANSWAGDVCASVANEQYRMWPDEYEELRSIILKD